jgi:hypothetical protein
MPGATFQALIAGAGAQSLTYVSESTTSASTSLALPAGAAARDLLVVHSGIVNTDSSSLPTNPTPTVNGVALTELSSRTGTPGGAYGIRVKCYCKVLDAGDITAGSVTGLGSDNTYRHSAFLWRPAKTIGAVTLIFDDSTMSSNDVSALVSSGAVGQTIPVIHLAYYNSDGSVSPRSFTPAEDGEYGPSTVSFYKYKTYNTSPAEVTIDMDDEGARNTLHLITFSVS